VQYAKVVAEKDAQIKQLATVVMQHEEQKTLAPADERCISREYCTVVQRLIQAEAEIAKLQAESYNPASVYMRFQTFLSEVLPYPTYQAIIDQLNYLFAKYASHATK